MPSPRLNRDVLIRDALSDHSPSLRVLPGLVGARTHVGGGRGGIAGMK